MNVPVVYIRVEEYRTRCLSTVRLSQRDTRLPLSQRHHVTLLTDCAPSKSSFCNLILRDTHRTYYLLTDWRLDPLHWQDNDVFAVLIRMLQVRTWRTPKRLCLCYVDCVVRDVWVMVVVVLASLCFIAFITRLRLRFQITTDDWWVSSIRWLMASLSKCL